MLTCYWVGVPKTLIISINWSTLDSPMKMGYPSTISAITHPTDHTSIAWVY